MDKLEQIEALRQLATLYKPMQTSQLTIDHEVVKDLCTLAKRGLATRKRPIAEAPKDGSFDALLLNEHLKILEFGAIVFGTARPLFAKGQSYTHFIPLSALEEE